MAVSPEQADLIRPFLEPLAGDLVELFADRERLRALAERAGPLLDPDLEVSFHGGGAPALAGRFRGIEGLVAGWRDWLGSFASYRVEIERVMRCGDRIVTLVRQTGRTIHGGVEVPGSPSAGVFDVRDGRIVRAAFYLDRVEAARAEGFDLA